MSAAISKREMPSEPPVRCIELVHRLIRQLKPSSDEYATAIMLADELNQTIKCDKCGGTGMRHRHENCGHGAHDAYVRGCNEKIICRKCHGDGLLPKPLTAAMSDGKKYQ